MPDDLIDIVREAAALLAQCRTASLATADERGHPHAANIQYVHDERLHLYFVSSEDAAHSRHIAVNPAVALTVYHHNDQDPANIRGLQLHGRATPIIGKADRDMALTLYTSRFPFVSDNPVLGAAVEKQTFYCMTPTWLRLIDNRRGFGWKAKKELDLNFRKMDFPDDNLG